ncbi:MAG: hypothetical protein ACRDTS_04315 [Mycobacterium sp.]
MSELRTEAGHRAGRQETAATVNAYLWREPRRSSAWPMMRALKLPGI